MANTSDSPAVDGILDLYYSYKSAATNDAGTEPTPYTGLKSLPPGIESAPYPLV